MSAIARHFPVVLTAWRWWIHELAALVPAALRQGLTAARGRLVLLVGEAGVGEIVHESAARRDRIGTVDFLAEPQPGAGGALRALARGRELAVRLPAEAGLRTTLALPLAAERNLAQVVSFELERRTPLKRSETYHAFRLLRREPAAKRLVVELCVAPRRVVDDALAAVRRLGVEPRCVELAGADRTEAVSPNLLADQARRRMAPLSSMALAALALVALLLAGAAVAIPLYRVHDAADRAAAAAAEAKQLADESVRLQAEIDAAAQAGGFLAGRKRGAPVVSEILDELTRLLPDDTWLTDLQIKGSAVEMIGQSGSASALIGLIDGAAAFASPSFRSPVTQDQRTGREQFDIAARVQPAAVP